MPQPCRRSGSHRPLLTGRWGGWLCSEQDRGILSRMDEPREEGTPEARRREGFGAGVTSEGVDEQANEHGEHRDGDPVGEALVAHAAVDGHTCLVALQGKGDSTGAPCRDSPHPQHPLSHLWVPCPALPHSQALVSCPTATSGDSHRSPFLQPALQGTASPWSGMPWGAASTALAAVARGARVTYLEAKADGGNDTEDGGPGGRPGMWRGSTEQRA